MFKIPHLNSRFRRPSHRDVFEHRSEWANSRELQPPTSDVEGEVTHPKRDQTKQPTSRTSNWRDRESRV
jgi:hypothetical protein